MSGFYMKCNWAEMGNEPHHLKRCFILAPDSTVYSNVIARG